MLSAIHRRSTSARSLHNHNVLNEEITEDQSILDTTNAVHHGLNRPQWTAFVSGLPMLEPESSKSSQSGDGTSATVSQYRHHYLIASIIIDFEAWIRSACILTNGKLSLGSIMA